MDNISGLTQKLHDLTFCREPNPTWGNGKLRASIYFTHEPTESEIISTADTVAVEIASVLAKLPQGHSAISQCQYALNHCRYDFNGRKK